MQMQIDNRTCGRCACFIPDDVAIVPGEWFTAWFGDCTARPMTRQESAIVNNFCDEYERKTDEN